MCTEIPVPAQNRGNVNNQLPADAANERPSVFFLAAYSLIASSPYVDPAADEPFLSPGLLRFLLNLPRFPSYFLC